MELGLFIMAIVLTGIYLWKVFLHYKLLRIENEGKLNNNEDYSLSFWLDNDNWMLKAKGGSIKKIEDHFQHTESNKLKERINKLLQIIWIGLIVFLISILISQIN